MPLRNYIVPLIWTASPWIIGEISVGGLNSLADWSAGLFEHNAEYVRETVSARVGDFLYYAAPAIPRFVEAIMSYKLFEITTEDIEDY